jgi:hypothetical protein
MKKERKNPNEEGLLKKIERLEEQLREHRSGELNAQFMIVEEICRLLESGGTKIGIEFCRNYLFFIEREIANLTHTEQERYNTINPHSLSTIEIEGDSIRISYLDAKGRRYLQYQ